MQQGRNIVSWNPIQSSPTKYRHIQKKKRKTYRKQMIQRNTKPNIVNYTKPNINKHTKPSSQLCASHVDSTSPTSNTLLARCVGRRLMTSNIPWQQTTVPMVCPPIHHPASRNLPDLRKTHSKPWSCGRQNPIFQGFHNWSVSLFLWHSGSLCAGTGSERTQTTTWRPPTVAQREMVRGPKETPRCGRCGVRQPHRRYPCLWLRSAVRVT